MNFVYILTNKRKTTLYIGVTANLQERLAQHKKGLIKGFTKRYNVQNLIYFEEFANIEKAILREKEIKAWSRLKKTQLIASMNPTWTELE